MTYISVIEYLNSKMKLSDKAKSRLFGEFRVLLEAGLDPKLCIELILEEADKKKKTVLTEVNYRLNEGYNLSTAMSKTNQFDPYEIYSIQIGEETGKLYEISSQLEIYYRRKVKLQRQLISALTYPALVLGIAFVVVSFMLTSVVPMFADIFMRFGKDLPPLTKTVLYLSELVGSYGWLFISIFMFFCVVIYLKRKNDKFRSAISQIILKTPILSITISKIYHARFCQVMHLLTSSKVPLTEAISLVQNIIGFYPMEITMPHIRNKLTNGSSLYRALSDFRIYDKRMISLIKVAEEVNQLDHMFEQLSMQYNDDIEHSSKTMTAVLEPAMIIIVAAIVGTILVALYLPLFKLSTTIN